MKGFEFHPELFALRTLVLETLAEHQFAWLSDFGSVDLLHDVFGIEVCGIAAQESVGPITAILRDMFPDWPHVRSYYKESFTREPGWKVIISRHSDDFDDHWRGAET